MKSLKGLNNATEYSKPFLRWAGSKRQLVPALTKYWSADYKRYIEPFLGSGSLFFGIAPKKSIISDSNIELINVFKTVKDSPEQVWHMLSKMPKSRENYYAVRASLIEEVDTFSRAVKFIYLNRFCFNGLYRTNNKGVFNVPYGGERSGSIPSLEDFIVISRILKNTKIVSGDFDLVLKKNVKAGDFVYLDPPYILKNVRIFSEYGPVIFNDDDFQRLRLVLDYIDETKAKFVMSYAYDVELLKIFSKWKIEIVNARRNIASLSGSRKITDEMIISNM